MSTQRVLDITAVFAGATVMGVLLAVGYRYGFPRIAEMVHGRPR